MAGPVPATRLESGDFASLAPCTPKATRAVLELVVAEIRTCPAFSWMMLVPDPSSPINWSTFGGTNQQATVTALLQ
jgi:hypothetical protein